MNLHYTSTWPHSLICPKCKNYAVLCPSNNEMHYQIAIVDDIYTELGYGFLFYGIKNKIKRIDFALALFALCPSKIEKLKILL